MIWSCEWITSLRAILCPLDKWQMALWYDQDCQSNAREITLAKEAMLEMSGCNIPDGECGSWRVVTFHRGRFQPLPLVTLSCGASALFTGLTRRLFVAILVTPWQTVMSLSAQIILTNSLIRDKVSWELRTCFPRTSLWILMVPRGWIPDLSLLATSLKLSPHAEKLPRAH